jgi:hypothetical protein
VKHIIDNLTRQHRELMKAGAKLFACLDVERLAAGAQIAHQCLATLTGILAVHLSMEDRSFYPGLIAHRDPELARLARRFLDERADIQTRFDAYRERWTTASAIERAPESFAVESRAILQLLWQRMTDEDERFHPEILTRWDA